MDLFVPIGFFWKYPDLLNYKTHTGTITRGFSIILKVLRWILTEIEASSFLTKFDNVIHCGSILLSNLGLLRSQCMSPAHKCMLTTSGVEEFSMLVPCHRNFHRKVPQGTVI